MDDFTSNSKFVVIFAAGEKACVLVEGWDSLVKTIRDCLWFGDDPPEDVRELVAEIQDEESWSYDSYGPFHYSTDLGEGRMNIYRVTNN